MAEIQPLRAVRYALDRVPSLAAVISPPYDVSDPVLRAALLARTPLNIIAADLADDRQAPLEHRYDHAAVLLREWFTGGVLVRDPAPALWLLEQRFPGPDGQPLTRRGVFARVRVSDYGPGRIRPHERTHPAAVADRLQLTRATHTDLSPVFALHDDTGGAVTGLLGPVFAATPPDAAALDDEGTEHRLWRVGDLAVTAALQEALTDRELLIADGHHRYEAARRYARERPEDEGAQYVLMLLVAAQDPGLVVHPTHRLVRFGGDPGRRERLLALLHRHFAVTTIARDALRPDPAAGPLPLGFLDGADGQAHRCVLRTQAIADAAMPGEPAAYRALDTAVLQALLLTGALGMTQDQIDRREGLDYARSDAEAVALVDDGSFDAAFFLRASPVAQVQAVAKAGVNMPAKSTSFAPKVPTGLLLSPL
ncbi:MAG: hypothetical protein JWM31_2972 [Solirubrobacterales bacterium]|nr:hypothetical protein [Solirubrobacterales bacterium]